MEKAEDIMEVTHQGNWIGREWNDIATPGLIDDDEDYHSTINNYS